MKKINLLLGIVLFCLIAVSFSVCDYPTVKFSVVDTERSLYEELIKSCQTFIFQGLPMK